MSIRALPAARILLRSVTPVGGRDACPFACHRSAEVLHHPRRILETVCREHCPRSHNVKTMFAHAHGSDSSLGATVVDLDPRFRIMPGTQLRATELPAVDPYAVEFWGPVPE